MIFKYRGNNNAPKLEDENNYAEVSSQFELKDIKTLLYRNNLKSCNEYIKSDRYFFSDIAGALFRKMFEKNLTNPKTTIDALLSCSYHIQKSGYSFLGFIKKNDEIGSKDETEIVFFKRWSFKNSEYDSKCVANEVFDKDTLTNGRINVFFVAGTQHFETLNLRIKRASILISKLINAQLLEHNNIKIILSGRNNAFTEDIKVNYSNESITMKNLITYRLRCYTDNKVDMGDFFQHNVFLEMKSRNSLENVIEMINLIKRFGSSSKKLNLFIISSTAHLLQLHEYVNERVIENVEIKNLVAEIFLVGSENPNHNFGVFNSDYIKYLINEIVYRNSKDKLFK